MLRLIGAALLAGGTAAAGLGAAARLEGRVRDLRGLEAGVEVLRRELGWRLAPLPEALERAAQGSFGRSAAFFRLCAEGTAQGSGGLQPLLRAAAEGSGLRLRREDEEMLDRLGGVLGRYDGDSQRLALEEAQQRLAELRREAVAQRDRLARLYSVLGITAGLLLVILFL